MSARGSNEFVQPALSCSDISATMSSRGTPRDLGRLSPPGSLGVPRDDSLSLSPGTNKAAPIVSGRFVARALKTKSLSGRKRADVKPDTYALPTALII